METGVRKVKMGTIVPISFSPVRRAIVLGGGVSAALAAAVFASAGAARAQAQGRVHRVGFLFPPNPAMRAVFVAGMSSHGWVDGRDFVIVQPDMSQGGMHREVEVSQMLAERPDVIITLGTARALAMHRATSTIPIVMWTSGYPVEAGLANSLARPGKNVTGNTFYAGTAVWGKMVELLKETKPSIRRIAAIWGYSPPQFLREEIEPALEEIRRAGQVHGLSVRILQYTGPDQVPVALEAVDKERSHALIIAGRASLGEARARVMRFAVERRLPTVADSRWPATDDPYPLLAYGASFELLMGQVVFYVHRILRGEKPGELPIQRPARIELAVSLRTAKAIGLTIPSAILIRADRVIE